MCFKMNWYKRTFFEELLRFFVTVKKAMPSVIVLLLVTVFSACSERPTERQLMDDLVLFEEQFSDNCPVEGLYDRNTPSGVILAPDVKERRIVLCIYGVSEKERSRLRNYVSSIVTRRNINTPIFLKFYSKGTRKGNSQTVSSENLIKEYTVSPNTK